MKEDATWPRQAFATLPDSFAINFVARDCFHLGIACKFAKQIVLHLFWRVFDEMNAVIILIDQIVNLYIWTLLAYLIIGWLVAFRIINPWQPVVRLATDFLARIHEPILRPIRRLLPDLGGIDISPIIVFLGVQFLRNLVIGLLTGSY